MATLHWIADTRNHNIMENKLDQMHGALVNASSMMACQDTSEKRSRGVDTEATSESDATARYDYTGMYRLSMMYDESSLKSSVIDLQEFGGYIALRPVMGDEYNIAVMIHEKSKNILTAQLFVTQNMDYVSSCQDQNEIPYDDIIGINNIKWMSKPQGDEDNDATATPSTKTELDQQERIQTGFVDILTKCDMIRFVGENLVLEGPKGAIECIVEE